MLPSPDCRHSLWPTTVVLRKPLQVRMGWFSVKRVFNADIAGGIAAAIFSAGTMCGQGGGGASAFEAVWQILKHYG